MPSLAPWVANQRFWLRWTLVTIASVLWMLVVNMGLMITIQGPSIVGLLLSSWMVGLGQGWVLRPHMRHGNRWLWATTLGLVISFYTGMILGWMLIASLTQAQAAIAVQWFSGLMSGLWVGSVMGLAQWWVLRRHCRHSWVWVPGSALAWGLGLTVGFLPWPIERLLPNVTPIGSRLLTLMPLLAGVAIASSLSGLVLATLLGLPKRHGEMTS